MLKEKGCEKTLLPRGILYSFICLYSHFHEIIELFGNVRDFFYIFPMKEKANVFVTHASEY